MDNLEKCFIYIYILKLAQLHVDLKNVVLDDLSRIQLKNFIINKI